MSTDIDVTPVQAHSIESFDHETDVLVIGFGMAGAAAAFEAAGAGARTIVLERASGPGGSSAMSGGEIYLGGGTSVQRACGFEDSPDAMYRYLEAALGPYVDTEKLRLYCDGSPELFEWFVARGVTFKNSFFDRPAWIPPTDDGLMWLGENASPYRRLATPAPRGHRPQVEWSGGGVLMQRMVAAVAEAGATTHTDTLVTNLVVDQGRIVGVVARKYGEQVTYRAGKGVVITTGGFVDNEQMLAHHAPLLVGHGKVSDGLDDGSGIRMAAALGANTRRMSVTQLALNVIPGLVARGILVNARGERFVAEDSYPGHLSVEAIRNQPGPYWVIVDQEGFEEVLEIDLLGTVPTHAEEDAAELEKALEMVPGTLQSTIELYNAYAEKGEDPIFGKQERWIRPLRGPLAAIDPRVIRRASSEIKQVGTGIIGFTLGGLHTTADGEVLDVSGNKISGLFAAGRAASGIHGSDYVSGTSLGDGAFFGRRAGRAAAGVAV
ncbi:FAD-dependent oxidoreductase [Streptosporangium sp. NPDC051022]|uniref:FAD-dependent oxidoreductase n=1 Tax=Streptosporangium sp. NPDC051022 TaxID=3155752 RepID=UPI00342748DB